MHGPNISNFKEIYRFLQKNNISTEINNEKEMIVSLKKLFSKSNNSKKIQKKLNFIGKKIINKTYNEINLLLKNEI